MIICQVVHQVLVQKVDHLHHRINNNMSIVCSTSNLNNIDKSTPTNYQLVFPKIPTETSIGANNPFVMNIHSAIIPPVSIAVEEHRWQGLKTKYALSPMEFDPWLVSFTVDVNLANWNLLRKWMQFINNNNDKIAEYHSEYSVDASMVITNNYGKMVKEIILVDIWPMQIGEISFSQREGDVVLESTVNFNYDYFYVRSTEWTDEFSSSSKSSSSSSESSSSSSLSSSSSSSSYSLSSSSSSSSESSSSSSSSSSLSSSSSSESSTYVILSGLWSDDDGGSLVRLTETQNLLDEVYCNAPLQLPLESRNSFGLRLASANPIWGMDVWCAVSASTLVPITGFNNNKRTGIFNIRQSSTNYSWGNLDTYGDTGVIPSNAIHNRIPTLGTNEKGLFGFRIYFPNNLTSAEYFKFRCTTTIQATGGNESNPQVVDLYPSEIKVMSGPCGPRENQWTAIDSNLNYAVLSNNKRTVRSTSSSTNQVTSKWIVPPGKWYWETRIDNRGSSITLGFYQGWLSNSAPGSAPSQGGGMTIDSSANLRTRYGGTSYDTGKNISNGEILMWAVDTDTRYWWFGWNGTWMGTLNPSTGKGYMHSNSTVASPSAGVPYRPSRRSILCAAIDMWGNTVTANFKESEQTYPIPPGFQAPVTEDYDPPKNCSVSSSSSSSSSSSVSSSSLSSSSRSSSSSSQVVGVEYIESTNAVANGTTVTIDRTALTQLQDNDFVMIHYTYYNDMDTTVIPAGFTLLFNERTTAGSDSTHGVLYKYITDVSSEPTSWTFGSTSSNEKSWCCYCMEKC
jgi:hypothetical protein